eukprot:TRINITY_DN1872_c0_g1_i1.p1 TRINITY_DN1872_c0_g1~~TRINITY_DN1872_c0_g1_i1.p1  ORF type:complete len:728 (-),score=130.63 TRINITY_DN1872_c0_g1_i1:227-2410(-)
MSSGQQSSGKDMSLGTRLRTKSQNVTSSLRNSLQMDNSSSRGVGNQMTSATTTPTNSQLQQSEQPTRARVISQYFAIDKPSVQSGSEDLSKSPPKDGIGQFSDPKSSAHAPKISVAEVNMEQLSSSSTQAILSPLVVVDMSQVGLSTRPDVHVRKDNIDRSNWTAMAMRRHPEVLEMYERLRPLHRATSFGRLYNAGTTEVKETLSRNTVYQLIMQHLQFEGMRMSRAQIEDETKIKYANIDLPESRLVTLLRMAIKDVDRVFDLVLSPDEDVHEDREVEISKHLHGLGVMKKDEDDDVDIWDEPDCEGKNITFEPVSNTVEDSREIRTASLNKLVERLTAEKNADSNFVKTFIMTYRSFTTPEKLLYKLLRRYRVPCDSDLSADDRQAWDREVQRPIQLRVCSVLKMWLESNMYDLDKKCYDVLNHFVDTILVKDGYANISKQLSVLLSKKADSTSQQRDYRGLLSSPEPKVPKNVFSPTLEYTDVDEEEIARQLTLVDFALFAAIQPSELLNQAWTKPKLKHRCPNLLRLIQRFNDLSAWVASSILQESKVKARCRIMARFIKITEHLHALRNYHTLMAINSGFNFSGVYRLKFTKELLPRQQLETLQFNEKLLSTDGSSKAYRTAIRTAEKPAIPIIGIHLTDLVFIEEGNPDTIDSLINFSKCKLVHKTIEELRHYRETPYNFVPVIQIQNLFSNFPPRLDDQSLHQLSLVLEPRGAERHLIA